MTDGSAIEVPTKWDPETGLPVEDAPVEPQEPKGSRARGPRPTPPVRKHAKRKAARDARKLNRG